MADRAVVIHGQGSRSQLYPVHARPSLWIRFRSGEEKLTEHCVEIKEGNLIRAFLPPTQSGASLTLLSSAGPEARYEVFDWDWRVARIVS